MPRMTGLFEKSLQLIKKLNDQNDELHLRIKQQKAVEAGATDRETTDRETTKVEDGGDDDF